MNIAPILIVSHSPEAEDIKRARAFFEQCHIANPITTARTDREAIAHLETREPQPAMIVIDLDEPSGWDDGKLLSRLWMDARQAGIPTVALGGCAQSRVPAPAPGRREPSVWLARPVTFPSLADFARALDLELVLLDGPDTMQASTAA